MVRVKKGWFIVWGGVPLCVFIPRHNYAPNPGNADMEALQGRGGMVYCCIPKVGRCEIRP